MIASVCLLHVLVAFIDSDIEDLTHKTGNFKQFTVFINMLESALSKVWLNYIFFLRLHCLVVCFICLLPKQKKNNGNYCTMHAELCNDNYCTMHAELCNDNYCTMHVELCNDNYCTMHAELCNDNYCTMHAELCNDNYCTIHAELYNDNYCTIHVENVQ